MSEAAAFDLVIRGGRVVDGTGMPSFIGDVAVRDGKVVETGSVRGKGREEIDASGLIVAPGVVTKVAGSTKVGAALLPRVCVPRPCRATTVRADAPPAPPASAARAKFITRPPAGPL